MARRATVINQIRSENEFVLLLDAGDSLVGDQDPARRTKGQTSVEVMNRLGYDAMALGPQDLGLGSAALSQRMAEAKFAMLSANAVVLKTGELIATPYIIREIAGYRVGIVGLSGGEGTSDITVRDPLATAKEVVAQLQPKVDVVILLSHAGQETDQQIADSVSGIALIISGGSGARPAPIQSQVTGTLILHADEPFPGHAGRLLGIGTFTFDQQGKLLSHEWRRLSLGAEIADDPAMAAWVQEQVAR